jgi:hypothetical protein
MGEERGVGREAGAEADGRSAAVMPGWFGIFCATVVLARGANPRGIGKT